MIFLWGFGPDNTIHRRRPGGWSACDAVYQNGHNVSIPIKVTRNAQGMPKAVAVCQACVRMTFND